MKPETGNRRVRVAELFVESVCFAYGSRSVVQDVSLRVKGGELVAIVGPNGCGKSTLLRVMVGELAAANGRIVVDGKAADEIGRLGMARRMALVPQLAAAPFGYTVREMVLMARHAAHTQSGMMGLGFETAEDVQLANEAMWAADVHHLAERPVNELSGGERQRVAIARAVTQGTSIMLLDEPTSSLDLYHQLELMEQLRRMTREEGRMALLVTHDLNLAAEHASRVIVMDEGKVVADGPVKEVLIPKVLEKVYHVQVEAGPRSGLYFKRKA